MHAQPPARHPNNTLAILLALTTFALGYVLGAGEVPDILRRFPARSTTSPDSRYSELSTNHVASKGDSNHGR